MDLLEPWQIDEIERMRKEWMERVDISEPLSERIDRSSACAIVVLDIPKLIASYRVLHSFVYGNGRLPVKKG